MPKVKTNLKAERPRHFIKEWRKFRGLTQERLAERIGVTHSAIQQLENGKTNYTQPMLEALAEALNTSAASLLIRDPAKEPAVDLVDVIRSLSKEQFDSVKTILDSFRKAS